MLYSFTTKNINQTYQIEAVTYTLQLEDSGNNVVQTIANGVTCAYYEDSSHYGAFGNGTHMTDQPLLPNASMTIWNSFTAPSTPGTYHVALTYTGHNASPVTITWTTQVINPFTKPTIDVFTITNATGPGVSGTVNLDFKGSTTISFTVYIQQGNVVLASETGWASYVNGRGYSVDFTPTGSGPLTMVVNVKSSTAG